MIQAIGLTSDPRRRRRPAVDDLTFEARPGRVTTLLGPAGAGKTTALRLMLQLQGGRGTALFRGRPLHQIPQPSREVGVLLGDVPGHPDRTARGHLRMLSAAAGVPVARADELLDVVGLSDLAKQRLGTFSLGMDRRLGVAVALLGDPHTLVLDDPMGGLTPRETAWLHNLLRGYTEQGGTVLTTTDDPKEAARLADRVVTLERGRLVADQETADFARTRLRPRVAVSSPQARRLAVVLAQEARGAARVESRPQREHPEHVAGDAHRPTKAPTTRGGGRRAVVPVEIVEESGGRICVYGSTCAAVGEIAYRHGILVHRLAEEVGDSRGATEQPLDGQDGQDGQDGRRAARNGVPRPGAPRPGAVRPRRGDGRRGALGAAPRLSAVPSKGPCRPLSYELRRLIGLRSTWLLMATALVAGLGCALLLGRAGQPGLRGLTGWPSTLPLPPAAAVAGLLGALSFGQEYRFPALVPARTPVPRRLGMLAAKLLVAAACAVALILGTVLLNGAALSLCYGAGSLALPAHWVLGLTATVALAVGSAWAGLLAAAVFRSTVLGAASVLAVPLALAPAVRHALALRGIRVGQGGGLDGSLDGGADSMVSLAHRLEPVFLVRWPGGAEDWAPTAARLLAEPVSGALAVSLTALFCAYACTTLYARVR